MLDRIGKEGKSPILDMRFIDTLKATQKFVHDNFKNNVIPDQKSIARKCTEEFFKRFSNIGDIKKLLDPDKKIQNSKKYKLETQKSNAISEVAKITTTQKQQTLKDGVSKLAKTTQDTLIHEKNPTNVMRNAKNIDDGWARIAILIIQIKICRDPVAMEELIKQLNGYALVYPVLASLIREIAQEAKRIEERLETEKQQSAYTQPEIEYQYNAIGQDRKLGYFIIQAASTIKQGLDETLAQEGLEGVGKKIEEEMKRKNSIATGPLAYPICKTIEDIRNVLDKEMTELERKAEELYHETILKEAASHIEWSNEQRQKFIFDKAHEHAEHEAHKTLKIYHEVQNDSERHCLFISKHGSIIQRIVERYEILKRNKETGIEEAPNSYSNNYNNQKLGELLKENKVEIPAVIKFQAKQNIPPKIEKQDTFEKKWRSKKMDRGNGGRFK